MSCGVRLLCVLLAATLPAAPVAAAREMRIFHVATGLDPGDGSGRPPSDYYVDGGTADGLEPGMRLAVHRVLRIDNPLRDGVHDVQLPVGELELLRVFGNSAVARIASIEPAPEAPLFEPRAAMIGDRVLRGEIHTHRRAEAGTSANAKLGTPSDSPHDSFDETSSALAGSGPATSTGSLADRDRGAAFTVGPEVFPPEFNAANEWFPLPPPVLFGLNSSALDVTAQHGLEGVALVLNRYPERVLAVEGRTCNLGSPRYNQALSLRRARTVAAFLQSRGVVADRLSVSGFGEDSPVTPNTTEAGRRNNRRVDLRLGTATQ